MESELKNLRIDRSLKRKDGPSPWAKRIIVGGIILFVVAGAANLILGRVNRAVEVDVERVKAASAGDGVAAGEAILNATGYVVAAHKIQVASKVNGRVAQILVEKGDRVRQGQVLVRLEDEEYRAQLQQARGQLMSLQARLAEAVNGSRPEEVAQASANVEQVKADLANARVQLERTKRLVAEGVMSRADLDDAQARYDGLAARVNSLEKSSDLVRLGPRKEQIDSLRYQVEQAKGQVALAETQLDNTVIRAPVTGTILERNVERGEFVTTGFASDLGAKGYVVSLADLNDLQVELDINQNDFAKLGPRQPCVVTTDAYPDRKYEGYIEEVAPEANRQKATVQVKTQIAKPDEYLRPEMNATVTFISDKKPDAAEGRSARPAIYVPPGAVRGGAVFVLFEGRAVRKAVKTGPSSSSGVKIEEGLNGGEDLITNPPESLKDGDRVKRKGE
jgi:HlyD family secretion protein